MRAPAFWDTQNYLSAALSPLSALYAALGRWRFSHTQPYKSAVPVICIGNITAGGAGKTPVALTIGNWFKAHGVTAFFLSRGYGGERTEPLLIHPGIHTALEVGDEPLLLARVLPTIVARSRIEGAKLAVSRGAKVIIMDDGFQNPSLAKDLSLLVIDGTYGFGNDRVLPAGPLRERPQDAFARAQGLIVVGDKAASLPLPADLPVLQAYTHITSDLSALKGKEVLAFCGIARPEKFFSSLMAHGIHIRQHKTFADHHPYTPADIEPLLAVGLPVVTTSKDAVKLSPGLRSRITVVDISLLFENQQALDDLLTPFLPKPTL